MVSSMHDPGDTVRVDVQSNERKLEMVIDRNNVHAYMHTVLGRPAKASASTDSSARGGVPRMGQKGPGTKWTHRTRTWHACRALRAT